MKRSNKTTTMKKISTPARKLVYSLGITVKSALGEKDREVEGKTETKTLPHIISINPAKNTLTLWEMCS